MHDFSWSSFPQLCASCRGFKRAERWKARGKRNLINLTVATSCACGEDGVVFYGFRSFSFETRSCVCDGVLAAFRDPGSRRTADRISGKAVRSSAFNRDLGVDW